MQWNSTENIFFYICWDLKPDDGQTSNTANRKSKIYSSNKLNTKNIILDLSLEHLHFGWTGRRFW